jgi:phosphoserine phosphatase RsbU/P
LAATLADGRFVTAFIGLLDAATHRLRFLSGGQGPVLHYRAALGSCATHKATSFPMGAMPLRELRPAVTLAFEPGDILVLLTDGIFEYEDPQGEQFGVSRVEQAIHSHHRLPAAELSAHLLAAVREFARGAPQDDDITAVLLKRDAVA